MNDEIIKILMRRDGVSYEEATQMVDECVREIHEVLEESGNIPVYELYYEVTDILAANLGLEPDYLEMLL